MPYVWQYEGWLLLYMLETFSKYLYVSESFVRFANLPLVYDSVRV